MLGAIGDHLWQSTLVAAGAALLTLFLRNNRAQVRHAVWLAASIKFLIPFAALIAAGRRLGIAPPAAALPDRLDAQISFVVDTVARPFSAQAVDGPVAAVPAGIDWLAHASVRAGRSVDGRRRDRLSRLVPAVAADLATHRSGGAARQRSRADRASTPRSRSRHVAYSCGVGRDEAGAGRVRHPAARSPVARRHRRPAGRRSHRGHPRARALSRRTSRQPLGGRARRGTDAVLVPPDGVVDWRAPRRRARALLRRKRRRRGPRTRALRGEHPRDLQVLVWRRRRSAWRASPARISRSEWNTSCAARRSAG